jgi:hypothetical protein
MERMGHSSSRAALIYRHASRDRDEAIATALGDSLADRKAAPRTLHRARNGHADALRSLILDEASTDSSLDLAFLIGAGEGNRTFMTSLEDRW